MSGYPEILGQLSVLLIIAFLSSDHMSVLVPVLALFRFCFSRIKMTTTHFCRHRGIIVRPSAG